MFQHFKIRLTYNNVPFFVTLLMGLGLGSGLFHLLASRLVIVIDIFLLDTCIKDPDCKNDCVVYNTKLAMGDTCLLIFLHLAPLPPSLPSLLTLFVASVFPSFSSSSSSFSSSSSHFLFMFPILYFGGGVVSLCPLSPLTSSTVNQSRGIPAMVYSQPI